MYDFFKQNTAQELETIRSGGLFKTEQLIGSPQGGRVVLADGREVVNLCSNNYLGYATHPKVLEAAHRYLDRYGFGLASVRFICGTQTIHRELEERLADFLKSDDAILYSSCFDANTGLFETLLGADDAIFSDELNHASIIDGIRLCKAKRYRYRNGDMADLEQQLRQAPSARYRLIATDGVFSMDGTIAPLKAICDLAERYGAMVMVDDSHATGVVGAEGRGTPELCGVMGRVDIITGTFGKALGGAGGGFTAARREIVALLRQRSRPYLFSNSLSPAYIGAALAALQLVEEEPERRHLLRQRIAEFRAMMTAAGFAPAGREHPITPIMIGDAVVAQQMATTLLQQGVHAVSFAYPVVPLGKARIRTQLSALHTSTDLKQAVAAFTTARERAGA